MNKRYFFFRSSLFCVLFFIANFFLTAQNFIFEEDSAQIDPKLQRNFTIIQNEHRHDLNPHTASYSSEAQILGNIYEGLFSYDPVTLSPLNAVAEFYKISRNKRRWTFTIRESAKFSDGRQITAEDVRNSWLRLLSNPDALYASLLDVIIGAREFRLGAGKREDVGITVKDNTLVVRLEAPCAHLNRILCHHAFSVVDEDLSLASGAFVLEKREKKRIVLKKNEHYWDKEAVRLPQVTIELSDDETENAYALNTGSADWVDNAVSTDKLLLKSSVHVGAQFGTQYFFFKTARSPWSDAAFRLALLTAVPWQELRKDFPIKAQTFIYPLAGYPAVNGFSETDEDEALALMKEARTKEGIPEDKKLSLVFAIMDNAYMKKSAQLLKSAWEALGVELIIQTKPSAEYLFSIADWDADLFSYTWIGDFSDPSAFLELFRGNSTLNVSGYNNEKFNELLDQASSDEGSARLKLLAQAEQLLLDEGVVLPVSHPVSFNAIDLDSIGGWTSNSLDIHPFKYIYFKQKNSKIQNIVKKMP
ncbi:peptide ABC transporter substrate-binding protein [Treponema parvum]|uniref:peptide ABC transporter substrate-binding protein n=1 Tax=Treponema parvum TaxID=138851 RepID=UPI001AEBE33A|nr:peptide ABC transporter substrate-binding protein [Treponema parvum]QTQ16984.1 peptide ABC transporter substrate-binding protein [Treponema parvum]